MATARRAAAGRPHRLARWLVALLALVALVTLGAPPAGAQAFDHAPFDALLRRHVVDGLVDYDAFKASPEFTTYLASLDRVNPARLSERERLAYWINVYNAFTIRLVTDKNERESIRNINKSLGFLKLKGPWSDPIVRAGGRKLSLDDVEHRIIRKAFTEPRIHFALVCAALGCPPLRSEAYTGAQLDRQLDDQARTFLLRSPAKNRVDVAAGVVYWSMIFNYYDEDFGGTEASIGRYIARFHPPGAERRLLESGQFTAKETEYDWRLNARRAAGATAARAPGR
jgi:hypothetical protein